MGIMFRKKQKNIEWSHMSTEDKAYLLAAYQRYEKLLSSTEMPKKIDNIQEWLYKRGISDHVTSINTL